MSAFAMAHPGVFVVLAMPVIVTVCVVAFFLCVEVSWWGGRK